MITLVNTNLMQPPIAPIGLDYIAGSLRKANIDYDIVDLAFAGDPKDRLKNYFSKNSPQLVALTFRNIDDCFWPSAQWFVPQLAELIELVRTMSDAAIVLGGVGFSIMPERILEYTGAEFGVRGDGELALIELVRQLHGSKRFEDVPGLIWRSNDRLISNPPAWPESISLSTERDNLDNKTYFEKGGQIGIETKRGCNRQCVYCADPLAKGPKLRLRDPAEVADEVENLLNQGIDVLHLCDSEFNIPVNHAKAVCEELIERALGDKVRWYTYMAVTPFDDELADLMKRAGCVGIDFTSDSASGLMLAAYKDAHKKQDLAAAVKLCRANGITVMMDLLLGGPGETEETLAESIDYFKEICPHCIGAALGVRVYPGTEMATIVEAEGPLQDNPNVRRRYEGPVDFFKPTFYISHHLGTEPAKLVRDIIGGDERFFEPMLEVGAEATDHNYNDNTELVAAIAAGARGAYWDILRQIRAGC